MLPPRGWGRGQGQDIATPPELLLQHFLSPRCRPGVPFTVSCPVLSLTDEQAEAVWSGGCGSRTQSW